MCHTFLVRCAHMRQNTRNQPSVGGRACRFGSWTLPCKPPPRHVERLPKQVQWPCLYCHQVDVLSFHHLWPGPAIVSYAIGGLRHEYGHDGDKQGLYGKPKNLLWRHMLMVSVRYLEIPMAFSMTISHPFLLAPNLRSFIKEDDFLLKEMNPPFGLFFYVLAW